MLRSLFHRGHPVAALAPDSGRAVVLTSGDGSEVTQALRAERPDLDVVEVRAGRAAWARTAGLGPVGLFVDDTDDTDQENGTGTDGTEDSRSVLQRFRRHVLLLADGGRYVGPAALAGPVEGLRQGVRPGQGRGQEGVPPDPVVAAVGPVEVRGGWTSVTRTGRAVVKLREEETTTALEADAGRGAVLARVPAASFDSRCEFREMLPLSARAKTRYEAPPAVLRRYDDALVAPHALVVQRGLVPADSFRHHPQKWLKHEKLLDLDKRYAEEPSWVDDDLPVLAGAWYHLDNEHRGHFGHVLTEQVARMWAWDDALRAEPEVQVVVGVNRNRTTLAGWELQLMEAAGISRDRVTVIDRPVRVERLLGATALFSMPYYVHPHVAETWDRIGASLRERAPQRDYPRRIFCSRKIKKRACHNARDVDALFARHGFEVVFPEEFPLPEQAAMFHEAEVVAGFAGSALFNVMFSDRAKHLVAVASETYTPRNEYLISALRGHRLDMSHSRPDEDDPKYQSKRFMSSFTFDFEREGQWLEDEVLSRLDP
ncbi:MAG: hypothetical protein AVDCRST_MAG36-2825 [uncultured Nocardioidaceae bacterium]|uniref:Glycosyltransferase 61 catalytic domain-containing protein n=1 Tax=uncultured Nocardioidaceae bacterium TaxID=253824 RepID=A0A6J4MM32_9ACTN|nr:MAG: hypothetical protein AVDCRST_MAG36-2825 [uncultured Nocardioidaceae bacterium]